MDEPLLTPDTANVALYGKGSILWRNDVTCLIINDVFAVEMVFYERLEDYQQVIIMRRATLLNAPHEKALNYESTSCN